MCIADIITKQSHQKTCVKVNSGFGISVASSPQPQLILHYFVKQKSV
jgi:hypothetical protein